MFSRRFDKASESSTQIINAVFYGEFTKSKKSIKVFDLNSDKSYLIPVEMVFNRKSSITSDDILQLHIVDSSVIKAKVLDTKSSNTGFGTVKRRGIVKKTGKVIEIECSDPGCDNRYFIESNRLDKQLNVWDEIRFLTLDDQIIDIFDKKEPKPEIISRPAENISERNIEEVRSVVRYEVSGLRDEVRDIVKNEMSSLKEIVIGTKERYEKGIVEKDNDRKLERCKNNENVRDLPQFLCSNPYEGYNFELSPLPFHVNTIEDNLEKLEIFERILNDPDLTISSKRLPILSISIYSRLNTGLHQRVHLLSKFYESWRRTNNDGNSFYRSIGAAFLEYLCNKTTHPHELEYFISRVENLPSDHITSFKGYLSDLYSIKLTQGDSMHHLQECIQSAEFDIGLIETLREIGYQYLAFCKNDEDYRSWLIDGGEYTLNRIKVLGEEAEEEEIKIFSEVLGVIITKVSVWKGFKRQQFIPKNVKYIGTNIHLLKKGRHYDILYTQDQNLRDYYDTEELSFGFNK